LYELYSRAAIDWRKRYQQFICEKDPFDELGRAKIVAKPPNDGDCNFLELNASFINDFKLLDDAYLNKTWVMEGNPPLGQTLTMSLILGQNRSEDIEELTGINWCENSPETATGIIWVTGPDSKYDHYMVSYSKKIRKDLIDLK
jgi:hypothetical protein